MEISENKAITEIASLASKHKIVPFLGAGASVKHLNIDWDQLTSEMAHELGIESKDNLYVAEQFEQLRGKEEFCSFLKQKLIIDKYEEDKDIIPLIVISLGLGLIYTTNQDNVFELCAKKFGRKYSKIVTLADLATHTPGDSLFIKYHGDFENAESIIFTRSSYDERIKDIDNFLNIRMRSDLLAKNFLFIGYSFRDPNIIKLFEELNAAFGNKLPSSFLIAYNYSTELEELNKKFGVKIIDPVKEFENKYSSEKAFDLFLSAFCKKTRMFKSAEEIDNLFRPSTPTASVVVTKYEIESVEEKFKDTYGKEFIEFFRATFDATRIPDSYQERVCKLFIEMARKCTNGELSDMLSAAAFNLILKPEYGIQILAAVEATAQFRDKRSGFDLFRPIVKTVSEELRPGTVALAIAMLREWGMKINDNFRSNVTYWIEGYQKLPDRTIENLRAMVNYAWLEHTTIEHPFKYWERNHHMPIMEGKGFHAILKDMIDKIPKNFPKPYEE